MSLFKEIKTSRIDENGNEITREVRILFHRFEPITKVKVKAPQALPTALKHLENGIEKEENKEGSETLQGMRDVLERSISETKGNTFSSSLTTDRLFMEFLQRKAQEIREKFEKKSIDAKLDSVTIKLLTKDVDTRKNYEIEINWNACKPVAHPQLN